MSTVRRGLGPMIFLTLILLNCGGSSRGEQKEPDVEFVATPNEVVAEMLKTAQVAAGDLVYDLGCGDGRIVIAAARDFGARGVGVDIDPNLIKRCQKNALKEGVTDRVRFVLGDLFEMDLRDATVVALYLTPELNMKLRPKLFRELRPGSRIVSHDFDMGDWKPDQTHPMLGVQFFYPDDMPRVRDTKFYYWVIPADVAGTWRWTLKTSRGTRSYALDLNQKFQEISGSVKVQGRELTVADPQLTGDRISFRINDEIAGQKVGIRFKGRISGNTMEGNAEVEGGSLQGSYGWTARRSL
jgi:SAM-dependent methyltransferase